MMRRTLVLLVAITALSACGDGGGGGEPELSLEPSSGPAGTEITLTVSGCESTPNGTLLDSASTEVATATFSNAETGTLTIPDGTAPGSYRVSVNCQTGTEETEAGTSTTLAAADASFEVTG